MNSIKAIIVDDEVDAREVLQTLIAMSSAKVDIVGTCSNVIDAVSMIREQKPDVVFLDVEMPTYAGYEIVNFFDEIHFEIIFVTAYDRYAIKAFELSAIDYIVKPISRERLKASLDRLSTKISSNNAMIEYQVLLETINERDYHKIVISELNGKRVLNLKDIICLRGKGSYTEIYLLNEKPLLVSKNLKHFEGVLPEESSFFRSQKSWIVNLSHVNRLKTGTGIIELTNGIEAKISKNRTETFQLEMNMK